jgi:hypothetical protein
MYFVWLVIEKRYNKRMQKSSAGNVVALLFLFEKL